MALWRERNAPEPERSEDDNDALAELDAALARVSAARKRLADALAADALTLEDVRVRRYELGAEADRINAERAQMTTRKTDAGIDYATYEALCGLE